jgi:acetyl-CoA C-acetyltransferase
MLNDPIVIVGAARTPMGALLGDFAALAASDLGAVAIKAGGRARGLAPRRRRRSHHGQRAARRPGPGARAAGIAQGGLAAFRGCTTVNKMCGSAMKAAMLAHDLIAAGSAEIVVAGGMESMSNAPYLLPKARAATGWDIRSSRTTCFSTARGRLRQGRLMGTSPRSAPTSSRSRARRRTHSRSHRSRAPARRTTTERSAGRRRPVTVPGKKGDTVVDHDEQPAKASPEKIPTLKPAFRKDGTVTAANSSSISDGARRSC